MLIDFFYSTRVDGPSSVRYRRSLEYPQTLLVYLNPARWATGSTMGQTAHIMSSTIILPARTRRQRCSTLGVMFLTGPLEAQRGLADDHEICARQCFPFLFFYGVDFFCRVTDTWSHRYSELLLGYSCYKWQDLILPSSSSDCFPERGRIF
jgi:hypothetical protein